METFCYRRYLGICGNRPEGRRRRRTGMTRGVGAAREGHVEPELRIVLITSRPGIRALLSTVPSVTIEHLPMRLSAVAASRPAIDRAMAAVIDAAMESLEAAEICRELQRQRAQLPVVTLLCCPASVASWAGRHGFYPQVREAIDADGTAVPRHASAHLAVNGAPIAQPGYAIAVH